MQPREALHEAIYSAAEREDKAVLNAALQHGPIDVVQRDPTGIISSPVYRLAYQNNKPAVALLLEYGAQLRHAALGYASGGHVASAYACIANAGPNIAAIFLAVIRGFAINGQHDAEIDQLLKQHNLDDAIVSVVSGYVAGRHMEKARFLLEQHVAGPNAAAIIIEMIWGCAVHGDEDGVNQLLARYAERLFQERPGSRDMEVAGYAFGEHPALLEKSLVARASSQKRVTTARHAAISGYARRSNIAEVNRLLAENKNAENPDAKLVSVAVWGYGAGGYVIEVHRLLEEYADSPAFDRIFANAARGFAFGGHPKQVALLLNRRRVDPQEILRAYLQGHHFDQASHFEPFISIDTLREYANNLKAQNGSYDIGPIVWLADSLCYQVTAFFRTANRSRAEMIYTGLATMINANQAWIEANKFAKDAVDRVNAILVAALSQKRRSTAAPHSARLFPPPSHPEVDQLANAVRDVTLAGPPQMQRGAYGSSSSA